MSDEQDAIRRFLDGRVYGVAGASRDRSKYGNKVLRAYLQNDLDVYAINPKAEEVEGRPSYADVAALTESVRDVHGVSIVTPPQVTEELVEAIAAAGIEHVWMQPGAESERAIARARELGLNVVGGGPCVLVALGYREG